MTLRCVGVLAAVLAGLAAGGPAAAQGTKSDSVVKAEARADKPVDGKQVVTVTLQIDPKYYLYANPVGNPDYESNQVKVSLSKGKVESFKVDYPAGTVKKDAVVGDYKVYTGKVVIKAAVQRAKGETGPLELAIKLQACSGRACLFPATVKVAVP
jgi:thiol:disulfide interchange protein